MTLDLPGAMTRSFSLIQEETCERPTVKDTPRDSRSAEESAMVKSSAYDWISAAGSGQVDTKK